MEVMSHCQLSDESPCRDSSGVTVLAAAEPLLKTYYKDSDLWKVLGANGHSITFAGEEATRVSKYRCSMMPASILHLFNQPPPACLPQRAVRPRRPQQLVAKPSRLRKPHSPHLCLQLAVLLKVPWSRSRDK
jgi:hypothetical protein